ncbi:hypothetical protein OAO18_06155 [Francisellaceae bacterium]|nr:hypothetical protein [Francisellaceae bacterium]
MVQLHLVKSKAGYENSKLLISNNDKVLFIEEATYLYLEQPELINQADKYFFLEEDLLLRGIIKPNSASNLENIVNYIQMVKLVKNTKKTITWF